MKDPVTAMNTALVKLLVAIVVLALTAFLSFRYGLDVGETKEKSQWQQREQKFKDAEILLVKNHAKDILELDRVHKQVNLKNTENHETALQSVRADLLAERAKSRLNGGLRIPAPVCPSRGPIKGIASTQTTGAGERDEEAPTTIELPEAVTASLWSIVGDADEVVEQARACQAWIIDNGFYGEVKNPAKAD